MRINRLLLIVTGALVTPAVLALRGGWAVVTVEELPDHAVAGRALPLTFSIRQHGVTLLSGLKPTIEISSGGSEARLAATPGSEAGHYAAQVTLPRAGAWTITINSGFGKSRATLLPLTAIEPGSPVPSISEADRGRGLFVAKGCMTCHIHGKVKPAEVVSVGPELTDRRYPVDILRQYIGPRNAPSPDRQMPDLHLRPAEIAALTAFINAGR